MKIDTKMVSDNFLNTENLEEISEYIIEGYGEHLLEARVENSLLQEFINHLPIYLKKIELIHKCCQVGNLEELQKILDRRKLAIARENKSSLFLTPLHVAITYNNENVAFYLATKFPETLRAVDRLGRAPLQLAEIHSNEGHMYNMLQALEAQAVLENKEWDLKSNEVKIININEEGECTKLMEKNNEQQAAIRDEFDQTFEWIMDDEFIHVNSNPFQPIDRDKYGRTMIHYAATRTHSRNALFQMLMEVDGNIAYRDYMNRTARDMAIFAEQYENVKAIDEYVLLIAANGRTKKLIQILIDGYDHILDLECGESIIECATRRGQSKTATFLKSVPFFEKVREEFHYAIRNGTLSDVQHLLRAHANIAHLLVTCKSYSYKCSLHIAVLRQKKDIVEFIIIQYPYTLRIGDNLGRTALHYAMALDSVEQLSTLLITAGSNKNCKDLKGKQPTYYFINKKDILQVQKGELAIIN